MPKADNRKHPFRKEEPSPTLEERDTPLFNAIWGEIRSWDINVPEYYDGYCSATGSHVKMVLDAIKRELAGLAFQCAGAATAPLMRDHPDYIFPSERVAAKVADVLRRHGIEVNDLPGYGPISESDPEDSLGCIIAGSSEPMPEDEA